MPPIRNPFAYVLLAFAFLAPAVRADITILSNSADWTLLGQDATGTDSQAVSNFSGSTAYTGPNALVNGTYAAAFGNSGGATYWQSDTVLHLQTQINLSGNDLASIDYSVSIDNDYQLYVNGVLENTVYHEGGASFSTPVELTGLQAGENTIDVIAVDRGGGTFFDMNVTGAADTVGPVSAPDAGSTALLFAAGLACLLLAASRATGDYHGQVTLRP